MSKILKQAPSYSNFYSVISTLHKLVTSNDALIEDYLSQKVVTPWDIWYSWRTGCDFLGQMIPESTWDILSWNKAIEKATEKTLLALTDLLAPAVCEKTNNSATIKGTIVHITGDFLAQNGLQQWPENSTWQIFSHKVFFEYGEIDAPGGNVLIFAKSVMVGNDAIIFNLKGQDGPDHDFPKADSGSQKDSKGTDGAVGKPGKHGGFFYLNAQELQGNAEKIVVDISSGTGGKGQDGGDGAPGKDGRLNPDPVKEACKKKLQNFLKASYHVKYDTTNSWGNIARNTARDALTVNSLCLKIYEGYGEGTPGGDAGKGGRAGAAGKGGEILLNINGVEKTTHNVIKHININAQAGENGAPGKPGKGGKNKGFRIGYVEHLFAGVLRAPNFDDRRKKLPVYTSGPYRLATKLRYSPLAAAPLAGVQLGIKEVGLFIKGVTLPAYLGLVSVFSVKDAFSPDKMMTEGICYEDDAKSGKAAQEFSNSGQESAPERVKKPVADELEKYKKWSEDKKSINPFLE